MFLSVSTGGCGKLQRETWGSGLPQKNECGAVPVCVLWGKISLVPPRSSIGTGFPTRRAMQAEQDAGSVCVRFRHPSTVHRAFHWVCDGPPWGICSEGTLRTSPVAPECLQWLPSPCSALCPPERELPFPSPSGGCPCPKAHTAQPCFPWGCQLWLLAAEWHRGCSVGSACVCTAAWK